MPDIAEIVESLSRDFSMEKLSEFLIIKNQNFKLYDPPERFDKYEGDKFPEIYKIGKVHLSNNKELFSFAIKNEGELIERSNKKAQ